MMVLGRQQFGGANWNTVECCGNGCWLKFPAESPQRAAAENVQVLHSVCFASHRIGPWLCQPSVNSNFETCNTTNNNNNNNNPTISRRSLRRLADTDPDIVVRMCQLAGGQASLQTAAVA